MKNVTFNNGTSNETVAITSLVKIGPERFVATTTEGFEIDLHESHIVREPKMTVKMKNAVVKFKEQAELALSYMELAEEGETFKEVRTFESLMYASDANAQKILSKFTKEEAEVIFEKAGGYDYYGDFEEWIENETFND